MGYRYPSVEKYVKSQYKLHVFQRKYLGFTNFTKNAKEAKCKGPTNKTFRDVAVYSLNELAQAYTTKKQLVRISYSPNEVH